MKIKEQTRKLVAGCSKYCFEVVDKTDEVLELTKSAQNTVLRWQMKLTWFEEIFKEADAV
ncbi:hypothetical protein [Streptococcus pneumoniae]|uniref:hypothetical protein n=1 Tax=Streptococcus pneumoniae TaxID=1313 RepID=UPI00067D4098|nr:hypothetical protein [Streptococcus pneumoniae]